MATADDESSDVDGISLALSGYSYDEQDSLFSVDRVAGGSEMYDPEMPDKTTEQTMKALEAAAEADSTATLPTASNTTISPALSFRGSGGWPRAVFEHTPILDAGPAPPDYSQATVYRTFTQSDAYRRRGREEPVLRAAEDDSNEPDLAFLSDSRKGSGKYIRRNWSQICLLNLAMYSLVVAVTLILRHIATRTEKPSPSTRGLSPSYPDHPSYTMRPERNERFHKNTSECSFDSFLRRGYAYSFGTTNFSFVEAMETVEHPDFIDSRVSGRIEIRPAPYSQIYPVDVWISVATTAPWKVADLNVDEIKDGWSMRFPVLERAADTDGTGRRGRSETQQQPCLDFWVGVYVKHTYETWELHSTHANIEIGYPKSFDADMNWWFMVLNQTRISTTKGDIAASFLDSPETDLRVTSGSITGNYSLSKSMNFTTTSGDIDVIVNQSAARKKTLSKLTSSTTTGDTHLLLTQEELPEDWVPRMDQYNLQSHHQSQSGTISLDYSGWEGALTGTTSNGSVDIGGTDFEYCSSAEGAISNAAGSQDVCVVKGSLNSTSRIECVDGNIKVDFREPSLSWPAITL